MRVIVPIILGLMALSPIAHADEEVLTAHLEYTLAHNGQSQFDDMAATIPDGAYDEAPVFEGPSIRMAAALYNTVGGLTQATEVYFADLVEYCDDEVAGAEVDCDDAPQGISCETWITQRLEGLRLECLGSAGIEPDVAGGIEVMDALAAFLNAEGLYLEPGALDAELLLVSEMAAVMADGGLPPPYDTGGVGTPWSQPGAGGGLGATPGGAQDFGYIREVLALGYVPLPFHFPLEGLFAEHDLPIDDAEPCDQLLCVRTASGVAPLFGSEELRTFVQFGYSSGLDPETFQRRPLNLAVVVDVSGSMRDWTGQELSKMEAVKDALRLMVDQLSEDDRLAIVLFNHDAWVLAESAPVADPGAVLALIDTIQAGGSTNIEAGLALGFGIAVDHSQPELRADRVMLFTDALPNTGLTGEGSFLQLATTHADMGIGLTTFGVGFNFGQELVVALSRIRDGAYFFLDSSQRTQEIFELDFDYLVTPLAYDLSLRLAPRFGFGLVSDGALTSDVATVFLSRRRGATVFVLERNPVGFEESRPASGARSR
jgi:Ca-activated chloride channel family protein